MSSKVFTLEGKSLKLDTAADIEPYLKELVESSDVEEARFHGNTLGVEACEALAKVLETKKTLQNINLADIFTGRLLSEIPTALTHLLTSLLTLPNLHTVNLSDNAFGLNTVEPLRPFLSQHTPLQHLILNNNGLGPAAGTLVAEALTQLAEKKAAARKHGKHVPDLETVVCGRNRLETGSMNAWIKAYASHPNMKNVKMVQNGIRQEGISDLLQNGLSQCAVLEVLDLQDNTFTAMGARALADVVGKWTNIKELGVGDSLLSARGGVMLAEALGKGENKALETLRLQYNEIDAKGLAALATIAKAGHLPSLQRIELNGNKFSEEDNSIEILKEVLDARKEEICPDDDDDELWGIDELDDLEEDSDDEEGDDDVNEDGEEKKIVKEADAAESQTVSEDKDTSVDELAAALGKTEIK